jgi:hypothetical protein
MGISLSTYCITTAVLTVRFEVSAQQRVYTPQYVDGNGNGEGRDKARDILNLGAKWI